MATSKKADEASSSSELLSSSHWIHEVFLSFRGDDTRNNFTGHLYQALKDAGINVYIDENELNRGEFIGVELLRAIQGSKICVIVFSRRYADSSWCLDELVKIMECRTTLGQLVLPVFYDVDPSDVRKQSGIFGEAFDQKHGKKDENKVMRWRAALTDAANLSGWDLRAKADGHEANFIRMIIQEISKFINDADLKVAENEIGIDSRMKDIISLLDVEATHDVRIVGIWGMGGIGKTTVAMALYNKFRQSFEASSFVADVRETMKSKGMVTLQESLLSDISKTSMTQVGHVAKGVNVIKNRLGCRRVFVVIDDVDDVEQLKALAIDRDSFGLGSRVLVTTRDVHLLKQLGVDSIYQARVMEKEEALKLFNLHAFKTHCPNEEYLQLSRRVVDCCGGLPLALKVLGSFLVDKSTSFWESEIKKLKTIPPLEVQKKLKISFDGLKDEERDIFLDISCFFIGWGMNRVKEILDSCDLFPDSGIEVLIQRCLVTVNKKQLMMHDLIRDMGREIVRANCRDNPGKWSRVWRLEDAEEVLREKSGSDEIQGFTVRVPHAGKSHTIETKAFATMKRLKFLKLSNVELTGSYKYLPNELRCLDWHGSPLKVIPKDWSLGKAGAIYLRRSCLRYVWKDSRVLAKLKILDLSYSYSLKHTPKFSTIPNLEKLVLIKCHKLVDVHQSIGGLERLCLVNLQKCMRLEELPSSFYTLKSLVTLDLNGCRRFKKLDEKIGGLTSLSILRADETCITELPSSIVRLKNLRCLYLGLEHFILKNQGCLRRRYSQSANLSMDGCTNITTTMNKKILQGWNFIGDGIILSLSDIPEWFEWVNKGCRINFQVPENRRSNIVRAITLCSTTIFRRTNDRVVFFPDRVVVRPRKVLVTNHSKLTTFSVEIRMRFYNGFDHLWLGHIPNYKLNLEGGDLVEISMMDKGSWRVKESGVSLAWDTQLPDFRVDTEWVDRACSFLPYEGYFKYKAGSHFKR